MKLVKKMAGDACLHILKRSMLLRNASNSYVELACVAGFEAGFHKAREMAADIASRRESDTAYKILKMAEEEV